MAREVKRKRKQKKEMNIDENKAKIRGDHRLSVGQAKRMSCALTTLLLSDWERWGTHLLVTKMLSAAAVSMK
jgi:hypothetical protein